VADTYSTYEAKSRFSEIMRRVRAGRVAMTFGEPSANGVRTLLTGYDRLFSSNLLEAEWRAALSRERLLGVSDDVLRLVDWVLPNRSLSPEIARVLGAG